VDEGRITSQQWKALVAAWLGWAFDGLDGYLYVLVALKFVKELMPGATDAQVQEKAGLIQAFFLAGWAIGGLVFGRIGDRLGRTRTLTLTVLTYAVFTGLSYFAAAWWHLLVFRFVAALGIGGEWAAGSALVSEMLHKKHRAWVSAGLQSGYMVGMLAAIATAWVFDTISARYVFLVGVLPALFTVWVRWAVPEPAEWAAAKAKVAVPPMSAIFAPGLRRVTLLLVSLAGIALTTVWAFLYFAPQIVQRLPDAAAWTQKGRANFVMLATVAYTLVNIGANFCSCYMARRIGYRRAFVVMMAGSLGSFCLFWWQPTVWTVVPVLCAGAFFSLGLFGLFPLYIPPQFPTLVRTLGAGFTYNTGRVIAGVGSIFGAAVAANAGGPHRAVFWTGLLYVLGVAVAWVVPEIPGDDQSK
jgi:MFS family permease